MCNGLIKFSLVIGITALLFQKAFAEESFVIEASVKQPNGTTTTYKIPLKVNENQKIATKPKFVECNVGLMNGYAQLGCITPPLHSKKFVMLSTRALCDGKNAGVLVLNEGDWDKGKPEGHVFTLKCNKAED